MSKELKLVASASGQTWYCMIMQGGSFYTGSAFEAFNSSHWTTYALAMSEVGSTGIMEVDFPSLTASRYDVMYFKQSGGSPATGDAPALATESIDWDGANPGGLTLRSLVDGVTVSSLFEIMLSLAAGTNTLVDNNDGTKTVTFKKQDGSTAKFIVTFDTTTQARSASSVT